MGAAQGHDGYHNIGVAAHITAASPAGPRYDGALTPEQRRHADNGIWLCQTHADLVDGDDKNFTVEMLRLWKQEAERRSFEALLGHGGDVGGVSAATARGALEVEFGIAGDADVEGAAGRVRAAVATDLVAFKRMRAWPRHPVELNLRKSDGDASRSFRVSGLALAVEAFNEFTVIAPPGTGKTTTLVQTADAIHAAGRAAALFIPLNEWSSHNRDLLASVLARPGFGSVSEHDLALLAEHGRLVLMLDGWNELDAEACRRATSELRALQRAYPRLCVMISTRREARDLPIGGQAVDIELLSDAQQLEVARAYRGQEGEALLDAAWRTPGVRDLVTIPLYLTALLASTPGAALPATKEEVLRLFARQHEGVTERAEALRVALFGFHPQMLAALATEATNAASTVISDTRARAVVRGVEDRLAADGQITVAPQPTEVLDVLVSQHALVRSGAGVLSFQHQQFQEWYASFEVEQAMRVAASGNANAVRRLRAEFLDKRPWEEPVLFACERLSREGADGAHAVAEAVLSTLSVDPLLAAEMIYRSSDTVWRVIGEQVLAFVRRWNKSGRIDRAVGFMIASGRPEFAATVWPMLESPSSQIYLGAMRAARRFRPSVLGPNAATRLAAIPDKTRGHVLSELARRSGIDGMDQATSIAKADPNADVQFAVIQGLLFRRGDRHARELLKIVPDAVWSQLAKRGYSDEITDADAVERLRVEREKLKSQTTAPAAVIGLLLDDPPSPEVAKGIEDAIAAEEFPARDQHAGSILYVAAERYMEAVGRGLLRRLEAGLELPYGADEYFCRVALVDDGPVTALALDGKAPEDAAVTAARVAGPKTAHALMDAVVAAAERLSAAPHSVKQGLSAELRRWQDRLVVTPLSSFVVALLSRDPKDAPHVIGAVAAVVARHGSGDRDKAPPELGNEAELVVEFMRAAADALVSNKESRRYHLSSLATAIGRFARPELIESLKELRDEDALRRCQVREQTRAAGVHASIDLRSDAATNYNLQYRDAFARMGEPAASSMISYLGDENFGFDAACVLKAIHDRKYGLERPSVFKSWPYLPDAALRRAERARATDGDSSYSDAIFAEVERLIAPGSTAEQQALAIMIARMAIAMPHSGKEQIIAQLVALPRPVRTKYELVAALVMAGESFDAELAMSAISDWIEDAKKNTWRFDQGTWEVIGWLELLPFSDRPTAVLDGLKIVLDALPQRIDMERIVAAAGAAPDFSEEQLAEMFRRFPGVASQHEWARVFIDRGTVSAVLTVIGLVTEGQLGAGRRAVDFWWLSRQIAHLAKQYSKLEAKLLHIYEASPFGAVHRLLEQTMGEIGGANNVLALVRGYARAGKSFDGSMRQALEHTAVEQLPISDSSHVYNLHPISIAPLRRRLFEMMGEGDPHVTALATECLASIDQLRDHFGTVESEPRHPDIASGRPWPLEAGGIESSTAHTPAPE